MEAHLSNASKSTRIQDLPSELLYEIFRRVKLEYEDDLDKLQQVCNRWYCMIDQWIGRLVSTSDEMVVHPSNPNLSKRGLDLISEIGVNYLHVKRRHGYLPEEPPSPLPSFKLPYLLKHLRLHGRIHPDLFKNLVKDTVNLSVLDLSLAILCHLRNSDLKDLNFPRLTKLRVTYCMFPVDRESELSLPNLQTFLEENVFPRLTRLRMDFPDSGLETIRALTRFLHVHPQLEKLYVGMGIPDNFVPQDLRAYQEEVDAIISRVRSSACHSLKTFRVFCSLFEIFKELVMRQTSLQSLDLDLCMDSNLNNTMLESICSRFRSTLVKLRIASFGLASAQLDCRVFSSLKVLRNLDIDDESLTITIIGSQFLPPTLRYLRLGAMLRSDEMTHILLEHPKLQRIRLYSCNFNNAGEGNDDLELRVELLQQVVQNRRVKELTLHYFPVSDEFPLEGIPNGDPIHPQILPIELLEEEQHLVNIYWKLNEDGYYSNF